jgi:hypothetical protein
MNHDLAFDWIDGAEVEEVRPCAAELVEEALIVGDDAEELERLDVHSAHHPLERSLHLRLVGRIEWLEAGNG